MSCTKLLSSGLIRFSVGIGTCLACNDQRGCLGCVEKMLVFPFCWMIGTSHCGESFCSLDLGSSLRFKIVLCIDDPRCFLSSCAAQSYLVLHLVCNSCTGILEPCLGDGLCFYCCLDGEDRWKSSVEYIATVHTTCCSS